MRINTWNVYSGTAKLGKISQNKVIFPTWLLPRLPSQGTYRRTLEREPPGRARHTRPFYLSPSWNRVRFGVLEVHISCYLTAKWISMLFNYKPIELKAFLTTNLFPKALMLLTGLSFWNLAKNSSLGSLLLLPHRPHVFRTESFFRITCNN